MRVLVLQTCEAVGGFFIASYALPFLLSLCTLVYAFKLRKNPDGLNEGKNFGALALGLTRCYRPLCS